MRRAWWPVRSVRVRGPERLLLVSRQSPEGWMGEEGDASSAPRLVGWLARSLACQDK